MEKMREGQSPGVRVRKTLSGGKVGNTYQIKKKTQMVVGATNIVPGGRGGEKMQTESRGGEVVQMVGEGHKRQLGP